MGITAQKLNVDRDVYEVSYDTESVQGETITARFENEGDVSVTQKTNDGSFIVTGNLDGTTDNVTITGSEGGQVGPEEVTF